MSYECKFEGTVFARVHKSMGFRHVGWWFFQGIVPVWGFFFIQFSGRVAAEKDKIALTVMSIGLYDRTDEPPPNF